MTGVRERRRYRVSGAVCRDVVTRILANRRPARLPASCR